MSKSISISLIIAVFIGIACSRPPGELKFSIDDSQFTLYSTPDEGVGRCDSVCFTITYSLINSTANSLLLYNLNREIEFSIEQPPAKCDSTGFYSNAEVLLIVFNESGEFIECFNPTLGFMETIDQERFYGWDLYLRKGSVTINPGEHLQFVDRVDLRACRLWTPGKYRVELFYQQWGVASLEKILGPKQIKADLARNKAVLFEGCLRSNAVTLIVE